ncbi:hypothetical protein CC78DRAFT_573362 [Lojkania enalia]|uniref:Uncharacterized protein n=1 Tax=Lojkania enalia TaxID=147567 RepID=A0A9P4ND36_9PLEO|nr:hypothetical protein CC78DRAFT_573362 [Didymosphaeria enalia]
MADSAQIASTAWWYPVHFEASAVEEPTVDQPSLGHVLEHPAPARPANRAWAVCESPPSTTSQALDWSSPSWWPFLPSPLLKPLSALPGASAVYTAAMRRPGQAQVSPAPAKMDGAGSRQSARRFVGVGESLYILTYIHMDPTPPSHPQSKHGRPRPTAAKRLALSLLRDPRTPSEEPLDSFSLLRTESCGLYPTAATPRPCPTPRAKDP